MPDPCICCGGKHWRKGVRLPAFLFGREALVKICANCGMGRTSPPPTINENYYLQNSEYEELFVSNSERYQGFARELLTLLGGRRGRLLDIGCGGGFLIAEALKMGFEARGIELNQRMVEYARSCGLPVSQASVQDIVEHDEKFDVIVLSAVLEHLDSPDMVLKQASALLNDNGVILVSQASHDGCLPRLFPWGWYGWQPAEHFWHFTPASMQMLAERCGLHVLKMRRGSLYHPWFLKGGGKVLLGRNLAAILGRLGHAIGLGDSFDCILAPAKRS